MTTQLTRRRLCGSAMGASVLLFIQACGGGGSDYTSNPPPAPPPGSGGGASLGCSSAIAVNHGHILSVALADLDSPTDKTYHIQGSADHDHTVTLTVAQLRTLKTGASVSTITSFSLSHQHDVVISCM